MTNNGNQSDLICFKEVLKEINYGKTKAREMLKEGKLPPPHKKDGRVHRWLRSAIREWINTPSPQQA